MQRQRGWVEDALSEVMCDHKRPYTAYELQDQLRGQNPKIAPTSVYRALKSMLAHGKIHRIESLNAYVLCLHQEEYHDCIMAICEECGQVEEQLAPSVIGTVEATTSKYGFAPKRHVIEVHGSCATCGANGEDT